MEQQYKQDDQKEEVTEQGATIERELYSYTVINPRACAARVYILPPSHNTLAVLMYCSIEPFWHSGRVCVSVCLSVCRPSVTQHHTYQPSRFLLDNQTEILPIPPKKIGKSLFFVLTCDASMPIYFEWTQSIFKQKYSKSSKFDTSQAKVHLQVGIGMRHLTSRASNELLHKRYRVGYS